MTRISGDFRRTDGMVKPMHGVGNAPLLGTDDKLFHFLGEAGIPCFPCPARIPGGPVRPGAASWTFPTCSGTGTRIRTGRTLTISPSPTGC